VGDRTRAALAEYGVATIGDLASLPGDLLRRRFGRLGPLLRERALGIDHSPVGLAEPARSVSHEHTFDVDTADSRTVEASLLALAEGVAGRLRAAGLRCRTVSVKVRDERFRTLTRQRTLPAPTDQTEDIWHAALELARPQVRGVRVRLLGVAASGLVEAEQLGLFDDGDERRRRATRALDDIRRRHGPRAIVRARLLDPGVPEPFERDPRSAADTRRVGRTPFEDPGAD
jgi:DNA polymerase IV